jgi:hypothetical protein
LVAVIALAVGLIMVRSGDDTGVTSPDQETRIDPVVSEPEADDASTMTVASTSPPPSSVPATAVITPTTATVTPTTLAPTTLAPTTVAPVETAAPSAAAIPTIPAVAAPLNSPGSPQVMSDPLPSGPAYAAVQPSFVLAQQLADALALADWSGARAIDPSTAGMSDAAFVDGYGGLDRASLLLLDARPVGAGFEMLVVSVAVELGGTQTSLYCLSWTADPTSGTVDQGGGSTLTTLQGAVSPEAIRNDPVALGEVGRCAWS